MDYIVQMLGTDITRSKWEKESYLPFFMLEQYDFTLTEIEHIRFLFLIPKTKIATVPAIKKHIKQIQRVESIPVSLELSEITRQRRESLIAAKIPFVVDKTQIYLPFLGVSLQEKFTPLQKSLEVLTPSAQQLLFYFIYCQKQQLYPSEAMVRLQVSAMTITRAVRQLEQAGLVTTFKEGLQKVMTTPFTKKELFMRAKPYLQSPVRRRVYIPKENIPPQAIVSGLTALSDKTMLSPPSLRCCATFVSVEGTEELYNTDTQVEIELWRYNPLLLSCEGKIDPLSLAISLADNQDERVELMIEEMLEQLWRNQDGTWI